MGGFLQARGWLGAAPVLALILLVGCQNATVAGARGSVAQASTAAESHLFSGPAHDLSEDERAGGHTLRKHVGLTEEELRSRLTREEDISGASTYTDRRTAEHVVGVAIEQSRDRIAAWLNRPGRHANLVLDYSGDEAIGRTMNRGEFQSRPCTHALIVLKYGGPRDYVVLTSYPECR